MTMTDLARYYPPVSSGGIPEDTAVTLRAAMSGPHMGRLHMAEESDYEVDALNQSPIGRPLKVAQLTVHRWAAPAPWTGRPFGYVWSVAVDDADPTRWVSGDVQTRLLDPFGVAEERS